MERKEMSRERTPKGGLYATQIYISFNYCDYWFWSVKQKGEKEMSSEKETLKGVRTPLRMHTSVNSCYQFFRSVRRMSGEKDAPKQMCMQLRYLYLSQFFSYWLRRESAMSDVSIYSDRYVSRVRTHCCRSRENVVRCGNAGKWYGGNLVSTVLNRKWAKTVNSCDQLFWSEKQKGGKR